ncbi:cupin domain-containing protein [Natronorubrum sp. JWXQ-INN-674]|uniref:Cupin domain-containing protein n=1 Tax=Natronorubrum halalkaliphilum TaxID=2691917 RepID=A0A6B0VKG4_9EURY|nr:cupin domain-containing protein [Natronorubrum halalkaliphilum]MXV61049.1 cupin domain-containing protein [Natronorubrum halalkaliphilum]
MEQINESDLEWTEYDPEPEDTAFRRKELSSAVGADDLGCSLYELPPGMRSWPYHYHTANEEALYVLAGDGLLIAADGEEPLTAGDFATLPADERGGHRIVNDGDEPLRYLMLSTMNEPDVTIYPEMEKFGVFAGSPPGGRDERSFHGYYNIDDETAYWEE